MLTNGANRPTRVKVDSSCAHRQTDDDKRPTNESPFLEEPLAEQRRREPSHGTRNPDNNKCNAHGRCLPVPENAICQRAAWWSKGRLPAIEARIRGPTFTSSRTRRPGRILNSEGVYLIHFLSTIATILILLPRGRNTEAPATSDQGAVQACFTAFLFRVSRFLFLTPLPPLLVPALWNAWIGYDGLFSSFAHFFFGSLHRLAASFRI